MCYLDDGYDGDSDPALGGELILLDPRMPQIRMSSPHLLLREADGGEQLVEPFVRPRIGMPSGRSAGAARAFPVRRTCPPDDIVIRVRDGATRDGTRDPVAAPSLPG